VHLKVLAAVVVAVALVGCGEEAPSDEAIVVWAGEYCEVHRELAAEVAAIGEGEGDPSAMMAGERLARAERIGGASIEAYTSVARELRGLGGQGQLGHAAEARARYYEARASAWQAALALFAESPRSPDFDAGNAILASVEEQADAAWRSSLNGLDPYVRLAAISGAECS
jgi:hypothetical protein